MTKDQKFSFAEEKEIQYPVPTRYILRMEVVSLLQLPCVLIFFNPYLGVLLVIRKSEALFNLQRSVRLIDSSCNSILSLEQQIL